MAGIWLSVERMLRGLQLPVSFTRYDDVAACGASRNKHEQGALPHRRKLNVKATNAIHKSNKTPLSTRLCGERRAVDSI